MVCAPVRRDSSRALGAQTMLYLTCTMISSVDLAHYGVSRAKDWVSVNCGSNIFNASNLFLEINKYKPFILSKIFL